MQDYWIYSEQFEAKAIDPRDFKHIDHVGVAWVMLQKYDFLTACDVYSRTIHALASSVGAETKFNVTITFAFLSIMAERLAENVGKDFEEFLTQNRDLLDRSLLEKWYSKEDLMSERARKRFLMPKVA